MRATTTLSDEQMRIAAQIGVERYLWQIRKYGAAGGSSWHGVDNDKNGWQIHIDGACAELAVAKFLGIPYDGGMIGNLGEPDVGPYQVRSTSYATGCLLVRDKDDPDEIFIMAITKLPKIILCGWMYGHEAKQDKFLTDKGNGRKKSYFVPQDQLRPMDTLQSVVEAEL